MYLFGCVSFGKRGRRGSRREVVGADDGVHHAHDGAALAVGDGVKDLYRRSEESAVLLLARARANRERGRLVRGAFIWVRATCSTSSALAMGTWMGWLERSASRLSARPCMSVMNCSHLSIDSRFGIDSYLRYVFKDLNRDVSIVPTHSSTGLLRRLIRTLSIVHSSLVHTSTTHSPTPNVEFSIAPCGWDAGSHMDHSG